MERRKAGGDGHDAALFVPTTGSAPLPLARRPGQAWPALPTSSPLHATPALPPLCAARLRDHARRGQQHLRGSGGARVPGSGGSGHCHKGLGAVLVPPCRLRLPGGGRGGRHGGFLLPGGHLHLQARPARRRGAGFAAGQCRGGGRDMRAGEVGRPGACPAAEQDCGPGLAIRIQPVGSAAGPCPDTGMGLPLRPRRGGWARRPVWR